MNSERNVVLGEGRAVIGRRASARVSATHSAVGGVAEIARAGGAHPLVLRPLAGLTTQELNGLSVNFGRVLGLSVLILPLTGLQTAFEINLTALGEVLAAKFGGLA